MTCEFGINSKKKNNTGFTLAEILITLAVIGIVAAITIPGLTSKYKKLIVETRLAKFYTDMNQAIKLSEIDNGDKNTWFAPVTNDHAYDEDVLTNFFNKYFKKYLKYTKIHYVINPNSLNTLYIYFQSGSIVSMGFKGHDYLYCLSLKDMQKYYSLDFDNKALLLGKSCFYFGFYPNFNDTSSKVIKLYKNKGLEPYVNNAWDGTLEYLYSKPGNYTKIIQLNGWKIPKDYPVKF